MEVLVEALTWITDYVLYRTEMSIWGITDRQYQNVIPHAYAHPGFAPSGLEIHTTANMSDYEGNLRLIYSMDEDLS